MKGFIVRPRALGVLAVTALAALAIYVGLATAATTPPKNKTLPSISGTTQVGQTLTIRHGEWDGTQPITYAYQVVRCGRGGNNCTVIDGATDTRYTVVKADVGHRLRVRVTAANNAGSSSAISHTTGVVTAAPSGTGGGSGPAGQIKLADGKTSIPASSVTLPERLIISGVSFSPNPVTSRNAFTGQFRVSDTRGFIVRGALVYVIGLPYGEIQNAPEQATDTNGYAQFQLQPTAKLPLHRGGALVMFVRARKSGDNLLAGVSTRRLVQVQVSAP